MLRSCIVFSSHFLFIDHHPSFVVDCTVYTSLPTKICLHCLRY